MSQPDITAVKSFLLMLQDIPCQHRTTVAGKGAFNEKKRPAGEERRRRMLMILGVVLKQTSVNFFHIIGFTPSNSASAYRTELAGRSFQSTGGSLVIHRLNPYVPNTHGINVRFFVAEREREPPVWWFGCSFIFTLFYGFTEDVVHWHRTYQLCQLFDDALYPLNKKWCDDCFFIKHRKEACAEGNSYFDSPIIVRRNALPWGERELQFQLYRCGRYVNFNLIWDRDTLFSPQSCRCTESVLISMLPIARWKYQYQPDLNSLEIALYRDFLPVKDCLAKELT
ncbi:MAG: coproporphyrinogen III oxidase [Candidatus Malihini olakiniferum]